MSFSIELDPQVADRLKRVPAQYAAHIVEQLDRLGENENLGVRIDAGPLAGQMIYSFVVEPNPRVLRLAVSYLFKDDETTLYITELGCLQGDADRLYIAENWPPE